MPAARPRSHRIRVSAATASQGERQEARREVEEVVRAVQPLVFGLVAVRSLGQLLQFRPVALDVVSPSFHEGAVLGRRLQDPVAGQRLRPLHLEIELELPEALGLVLVPGVGQQRLPPLHRLHDVVALDARDGEKGRDQRDDDRDGVVEAVAFGGAGGVGGLGHLSARTVRRHHDSCRPQVQGGRRSIHRFRKDRGALRTERSGLQRRLPSRSRAWPMLHRPSPICLGSQSVSSGI